MSIVQKLIWEMTDFDRGSPQRIQHFLKAHSFARLIGLGEQLDEATLQVLEAAAVVHDIGIRVCLEKYNSDAGPLQEKEGPALAEDMLRRVGCSADATARVCYLVGHHHTYGQIDEPDYQILVEADFLVNLFEHKSSPDAVRHAYQTMFKTETGRELCRRMFDL